MTSRSVAPTAAEVAARLPGDDVVPAAGVVMDRAFTLDATPEEAWPWFVQLGKQRAGWYLPRWIERFVPPERRATRRVEPDLQDLAVGDVVADWGGRDASFEVAVLEPPGRAGPAGTLVHVSTRGRIRLSWAIVVRPDARGAARVHLRLRLGGVRREQLARIGGGFFDWLTVVGLAAGLRERVRR